MDLYKKIQRITEVNNIQQGMSIEEQRERKRKENSEKRKGCYF